VRKLRGRVVACSSGLQQRQLGTDWIGGSRAADLMKDCKGWDKEPEIQDNETKTEC